MYHIAWRGAHITAEKWYAYPVYKIFTLRMPLYLLGFYVATLFLSKKHFGVHQRSQGWRHLLVLLLIRPSKMSSHRLRFARPLTCIAWCQSCSWQLIATNYRFYFSYLQGLAPQSYMWPCSYKVLRPHPLLKISPSPPFKMITWSHMIISVHKMAANSDSRNGAALNVIVGWNRSTTILSTSFQKYKQRDVRLRAVRAYNVNLAPVIPSWRTRSNVLLEKTGHIRLLFNLTFGFVVESDTQLAWSCMVYSFPTTAHAAGIKWVQKELHYNNQIQLPCAELHPWWTLWEGKDSERDALNWMEKTAHQWH